MVHQYRYPLKEKMDECITRDCLDAVIHPKPFSMSAQFRFINTKRVSLGATIILLHDDLEIKSSKYGNNLFTRKRKAIYI